MPTNKQIIEKYKNEKILIKTFYQIKNSDGKLVNLNGVVTPLKIDNRQKWSVIDDQGTTSQCACYSICGICEALIWKRTGKLVNFNAEQVYALAKQKDGMVNEDGTYLETAIQAALELGGFSELANNIKIGYLYNKKQSDLKLMIKHLLHKYDFLHAGFNICSGWYNVTKDNDYTIQHTNVSCGGHAVAIVGADEDSVYIANSWGKKWGATGFAQLKWDDVYKELIYICYLQNCFDNMHE